MTTDSHWIAREGAVFILLFLLVTMVLLLLHPLLSMVGLIPLSFSIYFFRNPRRVIPRDAGLFTSPADGRVIFVGQAFEGHFFKKEMMCVSIFMSPFNVHVNRSPESGVVVDKAYHRGRFLAAFDPKASMENERMAIRLRGDRAEVVFVQVAGWLARRIVCYPEKGCSLQRGQIFGLIKFGSRMDVYFPSHSLPQVVLNQTVRAGETVLAQYGEEGTHA